MLTKPVIRSLIFNACKKDESFAETIDNVKNFIHRKVTSKLHPATVLTADKVIYIFDVQLPIILLLGSGLGVSLFFQLSAESIAPWLVPGALYTLYDSINMMDIYPYTYLNDMTEVAASKAPLPQKASLKRTMTTERLYKSVMRDDYNDIVIDETDIEFIKQFSLNFLKSECNNVLLHGHTGSGKTAYVEALAKLVISDQCPEHLKGYRVMNLNLDELLAQGSSGMSSSVEMRLISVLDTLQMQNGRFIVVIDGIDRLMESADGRTSIINLLKTYLTKGFMKVLGIATTDDASKKIAKDEAAKRRFTPTKVPIANDQKCYKILESKFSKKFSWSQDVSTHTLNQADLLFGKEARPGSVHDLMQQAYILRLKPSSTDEENVILTETDIDKAVKYFKKHGIKKQSDTNEDILKELREINERIFTSTDQSRDLLRDPFSSVRYVSKSFHKTRKAAMKTIKRPRSNSVL